MPCPPGQAVVILGSSRRHGNTRRAVDAIVAGRPVRIVDLSRLRIAPYDDRNRNAGDDFLPLVESIAAKRLWILATPVYWHAMSGPLKLFVDRLADLLAFRRDLGRRLAGASLAVVATGTGPKLPPGFQSPLRSACEYLGMRYLGAFYGRFREDDRPFPHLAARARRTGSAWIG